MSKERVSLPKRDGHPNRMEPAWYELADANEALKLKQRQDARAEAWRDGREAEVAHPEEYEGVLLVGGKRYGVGGNYRADLGVRPKTAAERMRGYRARRKREVPE